MACSEPEAVLVPGGLLAPRLVHAPRQLSSGSADGAIFEGGSHIVSGGTSGLGLLTGRWIAERGARELTRTARCAPPRRLAPSASTIAAAASPPAIGRSSTPRHSVTYRWRCDGDAAARSARDLKPSS